MFISASIYRYVVYLRGRLIKEVLNWVVVKKIGLLSIAFAAVGHFSFLLRHFSRACPICNFDRKWGEVLSSQEWSCLALGFWSSHGKRNWKSDSPPVRPFLFFNLRSFSLFGLKILGFQTQFKKCSSYYIKEYTSVSFLTKILSKFNRLITKIRWN